MSNYWSNEEFIEVIKQSITISEVLRHFGCPTNQGHYNRAFHKSVDELQIDISHLIEGARSKLQNLNKKSLDELLIQGVFRNTTDLKNRLIKDGVLINQCYNCNMQPIWDGKELKLHLDHINGDNTDNRIKNLRLLCPNCHSQTDTYCGAKKKKEQHAYKFVCKKCGGPKKTSKSEFCSACVETEQPTKIIWPAPETVLQMTQETNFVTTAKSLGVSDNAVRKFLTKNNLKPKNGRN